jgi:hypothetical protein
MGGLALSAGEKSDEGRRLRLSNPRRLIYLARFGTARFRCKNSDTQAGFTHDLVTVSIRDKGRQNPDSKNDTTNEGEPFSDCQIVGCGFS